ncbi:DUF222 domain-containing protein [Catenuloplanes japonicus]|uniref:DUF222 domain-containing protein n=1 Tax=Catenuloplanes japonicus TaxID=33876 RepID=UPI000525B279|nr:DUF222 domain-containing protein [Catenuloplanes japonicus]
MTHTPTNPADPQPASLLDAVRNLRAAAMSCTDGQPWSMPDDDVLAALAEAHAAQQAVTALLLHLIQQADIRSLTKIKRRAGTSAWLAEELHLTVPAARRLAKRARQVCTRPRLAAALRTGRVNAEQAGAIARTVHDLPDTIDATRADAAETMLIAEADRLDAVRLARSSDHVLDLLDPPGAAARETARRREAATAPTARTTRRLSVTPAADGDAVRLTGVLDARSAAVLEAALHRYGAPSPATRHTPIAPHAPEDTPAAAERRADALVEICRLSLVAPTRPAPDGRDALVQPLTTDPTGVVVALNTPRTRLPNRTTRKRTKSTHHGTDKNGRRHPTRR